MGEGVASPAKQSRWAVNEESRRRVHLPCDERQDRISISPPCRHLQLRPHRDPSPGRRHPTEPNGRWFLWRILKLRECIHPKRIHPEDRPLGGRQDLDPGGFGCDGWGTKVEPPHPETEIQIQICRVEGSHPLHHPSCRSLGLFASGTCSADPV